MHPADWYPDPFGRYEYRFHNGATWTADVSTGGIRYVDPLGATPSGGPPVAAPRSRRDGLATAAMVLGIVGLSISWAPLLFVAGAVCALLALVFGTIALRRRKPQNRGFALAGVLTGGSGLLMVGVGVWTTSLVVNEVDDYTNPPPAAVEITHCVVDGARLVIRGTLRNLGDHESDYRVLVDVSSNGLRDQRIVVAVDDVVPGPTVLFGGPIRGLEPLDRDDEPSCEVDDVTGPLPFGLDVESG